MDNKNDLDGVAGGGECTGVVGEIGNGGVRIVALTGDTHSLGRRVDASWLMRSQITREAREYSTTDAFSGSATNACDDLATSNGTPSMSRGRSQWGAGVPYERRASNEQK